MLKQAVMLCVLCHPVLASAQTIHVIAPGGPFDPMKVPSRRERRGRCSNNEKMRSRKSIGTI
jgi:hypothetical protein